MTDDIFKVLQDEMTADTDDSGVPYSPLFWDDALGTVAEAYEAGAVTGNAHLEMRAPSEAAGPGTQEIVVSPKLQPFTVEEPHAQTLVGSSTDRDMSILPMTIQVQSRTDSMLVPALLGVTRGGQRWARLGGESGRRLFNLDEAEAEGSGSDPLLNALALTTRMQQVHMGVDLPEPGTTPLDLITSLAVQQAAHAAAHTPAPRDLYVGGAARGLSAQVVMRVVTVRSLLNFSPAIEDLPVNALIRLDTLSERVHHLGCGRPDHSSRSLSPGATAVLRAALSKVRGVTWDDVRPEDLTGISGIDTADAKWWGSRGIAEVCKYTTGGVTEAWSNLSQQVGPYLDPILEDAERVGLVLPPTS